MEVPSRRDIIHRAKEEHKPVVAVLPVHYPREFFRAFGMYTVEVWGPPGIDVMPSSSHVQSYVCSVIHSITSFFLKGGLKDVDMVVVPHSCDSLQGLGSLLLDFIDLGKPVYPLYLPRGVAGVEFLTRELINMRDKIASVVGFCPSNDDFMECILVEEQIDKRLLDIYRLRKGVNSSSLEFYRLLRLREYLPPGEFLGLLDRFDGSDGPDELVIPVVLSGLLPEPMSILDEIDMLGGVVSGDDFACLRRRVYGAGSSSDPFVRMAERIINGPPDSTKGSSLNDRALFLRGVVETAGAKGVVFYSVKFCEPEKFYHPVVRDRLKRWGIPSIEIEIDINEPLPQQVITRIGAFLESLRGV